MVGLCKGPVERARMLLRRGAVTVVSVWPESTWSTAWSGLWYLPLHLEITSEPSVGPRALLEKN